MADKKISQLTGATTPLAGTEVLPIVQGGSTVKVSIANVTAGRSISTAGASLDGAVTINDSGADVDFRVEGDTEANLIFADASADKVGFGTNAPDQRVTITSGGLGLNRFNTTITPVNDSKGLIYVRQNGNAAGTQEELRYMAVNHGFYSHTGVRIATFDSNANLKIETAAKGIDFSANTGAAGETSALLNWYEEGTWTPTYGGLTSDPTVSYAAQTEGKYTRIGNIVYVSAALRTASVSGGSGSVVIRGLPFTVASAGTGEAENSSFSIGFASAFDTVFPNAAFAAAGTTYIRLRVSSSSAATTSLDVANLQTGANQNYLYLSGFYFVS